MPTTSDDWDAESVAQYRIQYGVEQWLVKWRGYSEDHNTWEPWGNLLTKFASQLKFSPRGCAPHPARVWWLSPAKKVTQPPPCKVCACTLYRYISS